MKIFSVYFRLLIYIYILHLSNLFCLTVYLETYFHPKWNNVCIIILIKPLH